MAAFSNQDLLRRLAGGGGDISLSAIDYFRLHPPEVSRRELIETAQRLLQQSLQAYARVGRPGRTI